MPLSRLSLPLLASAVLLAGCSCPPLEERYDSPVAALATWQAQLCRDDAPGEYRCLSADFRRRMAGFQNYHAARSAFLRRQPFAAWLLARADLLDHVSAFHYGPDGASAELVLEAGGEALLVRFSQESWATLEFDDGSRRSIRQPAPPATALALQDGQAWLPLSTAELTPEQLELLRALSLQPRWLIDDLAIAGDSLHPDSPSSKAIP